MDEKSTDELKNEIKEVTDIEDFLSEKYCQMCS